MAMYKMSRDNLEVAYANGMRDFNDLDFSGENLNNLDLSVGRFVNCLFQEADCFQTDFSHCDLHKASFDGASLTYARFKDADLSDSTFFDANLAYVDFCRANLHSARMSSADAAFARFDNAKLWYTDLPAQCVGTCIDTDLLRFSRRFVKECPPLRTGGRIVYRAQHSNISNSRYLPGKTYIANVLSWSTETDCHPGIYAGSARWIFENLPGPYVKCYVRDGEWTITAKGCIRCARIRVLAYITVDELEEIAFGKEGKR